MQKIKKVCVYCASSDKIDEKYFEATRVIAKALVKNNTTVVYGGGARGLMGTLADTVIEESGRIIGIMPHFMKEVEFHHKDVNEFIFTADMHERKKQFMVGVDALITLPGGCGTFEELMEAITLKRLGIFTKPIVILNLDGYYDPLLHMLEQAIEEGFLSENHRPIWTVLTDPTRVLEAIQQSAPWSKDAIKFAQV
ncbi:Rossman fold protein, TIGR00730 family [Roseivirga sp. 4D4]|uniref:LOG family protein n=1 Tax=Roseivirga sp. 4D4 TaxID=1889784 RepID=UPI000852FDD2|nr:TIGR00730 family Rossman fold protein [Roseivirga sp. 4D4]OEK01392.1 Rossman fold protein, TIGR00730 family [Roseivirga sp. 4D4]